MVSFWSLNNFGSRRFLLSRNQKDSPYCLSTVTTDPRLPHLSSSPDRSIAQVALRWLIQKDVTTSVIIGARTMEQLDQNMAVNGWTLSPEEVCFTFVLFLVRFF